MIKDIYGQRKGSLDEYELIKDTDEADFTAKLASLKSKWKSHCAGFFDWFLRKRKEKMISSVICSVREGTDVCGPFLPKWCRISAFCWKSSAKFQEEKREGCSSWFENDNREARKRGSTCHPQSWIIQGCFLLHASFYHKTKIKDYSIHVLKTILWAKTLKNYSNFFWIIWVKLRRWSSNPLKNKRCYIYLPIPYNRSSLSRDHQRVTTMNPCCYCFDHLLKVKAKYIVLCLSALAKSQNARGAFHHPALMGNCPTCSHMPWPYQSTKWFVISPSQVMCGAWDSVASKEVPLEKKVDTKCMQVNVLKNIARMTRRLYVLIMPHTRFKLNLHSVVA